MSINITLYLICSGTSSYDIIKTMNNIKINNKKNENNEKNKKKSFLNYFKFSDIKNTTAKEEFYPLEDIGMKEMYMCQEYNNNDILKNTLHLNRLPTLKLYTSLDLYSIESAFILLNKFIPSSIVYPTPYISNKTNLTNRNFIKFKQLFGEIPGNYDKYWTSGNIKINDQFINIKKNVPNIDWSNCDNQKYKNDLSSYNLKKFIKLLMDEYKSDHVMPNAHFNILCNYELIEDLLKKFTKRNKKIYDNKKDIIEHSSIWTVTLLYNDITNEIVDYIEFQKLYPTRYNHGLLGYKLVNNIEVYNYIFSDSISKKNKEYILFNSVKDIPIQYIKNMNFYRLSSQSKKIIMEKIDKLYKVNQKKKENENKNMLMNKKMNTQRTPNSLENIIKELS
jgi:hypothetical protein